jgi:hypothetical protein
MSKPRTRTVKTPKAPVIIDLQPTAQDQFGPAPDTALLPNFDIGKIVAEITALESEAQTAKGVYDDRSTKIAAILWEVKQHHPEHLDEVCERTGIGRSRKFELLQIGSGRKSVKQSRQESAKRQTKSRVAKKGREGGARSRIRDVTDSKPSPDTDPDEGAARMKAAYAANEGAAKKRTSGIANTPKAEFQFACDHWIPRMSRHDQIEALRYVQDIVERLGIPADIIASASEIDPS